MHTDESHSFVCCLSSLNISKYEEWKNTNLIYDAIWFLDGVLEEFIQKQKAKSDLQTQLDQRKKVERLASEYWGWHNVSAKKRNTIRRVASTVRN